MVEKIALKVIVDEAFCKACERCIKFCPEKALSLQKKVNAKGFHPVQWQGNCKLCGICYLVCPDSAIEVKHEKTLER